MQQAHMRNKQSIKTLLLVQYIKGVYRFQELRYLTQWLCGWTVLPTTVRKQSLDASDYYQLVQFISQHTEPSAVPFTLWTLCSNILEPYYTEQEQRELISCIQELNTYEIL